MKEKIKNFETRRLIMIGFLLFVSCILYYFTYLRGTPPLFEIVRKIHSLLNWILFGLFVAHLIFIPLWSIVKKHIYGPFQSEMDLMDESVKTLKEDENENK